MLYETGKQNTEHGMYNSIEMCTWFWWGMETDHLEDLGIDGRIV